MKLELFRYYCPFCGFVWEEFLPEDIHVDCLHCATPCAPNLITEE